MDQGDVSPSTEFVDIEAKKAELKKQIEALPDNMIYGAHVTGDDVAKNIYDTQFKYSLGTALQGTIGLTSKKGLLDLMNNLLDGRSPHRNQFGVFILAFPKSEFGETSADRKVNLDTIESDMLDNYPEFLEGKIPTKFNFGYFKDGKLFTKNAELAVIENNRPVEYGEVFVTGTGSSGENILYGKRPSFFPDRRMDTEYNKGTKYYFAETVLKDKKVFTLVDTTILDGPQFDPMGRDGFIATSIMVSKDSPTTLNDVKADLKVIHARTRTSVNKYNKIDTQQLATALTGVRWISRKTEEPTPTPKPIVDTAAPTPPTETKK